MYEHVIYMMNSPFEGWHIIANLAWWNKNLDSWTNSTMKIFWGTVIMSPTSLEFKMLQEGLARMQNNVYRAYILKVSSNLFKWNKGLVYYLVSEKGLLLSQWSPSWRQYRGPVGNEKARVPTVTSLSTQRRVGVYTNLNLD